MNRGHCAGCQRPVVFAGYLGATLVLEVHETGGGPERYAIWDDGTVHFVAAGQEVLAYPVHVCEALERLRKEGAVSEDYVVPCER